MQNSFVFPRFVIAIAVVSFLGLAQVQAQSRQPQRVEPAGLNAPPPAAPDLFEVSLGFNYIYMGDAYPETRNLYGVDGSFFVNATSWMAVGADFMANFGTHSVPVFFGNTADVDSQRYVYVFGPRVTVWHDPRFRVFAEALAGGVHAEADFTLNRGLFTNGASANASDDGFATVIGGGFDWRLTNHLSWRVIQADYLGTGLGSDWQSNFRASTGIVYSFGSP